MPQYLGLRTSGDRAQFVGVTHDELAGLDGSSRARMDNCTTSFNVRIMKTVLESEGITSFRKFTKLQPVDDGHLRKIVVTLSRALQNGFEVFVGLGIDRHCDVHVGSAEWMLPISWSVIADIIQNGRSSRHAFPKFLRKSRQRCRG